MKNLFSLLHNAVSACRTLARSTAGATIKEEAPYHRPDAVDLIGPDWDCDFPVPAKQTLIICSAPRTGSYELCRFLTAAGLGVPHEYFHPNYAGRLRTRWSLTDDPLSESGLASYIEVLRRRRAAGGIFSIKLQYWQFDAFLRNRQGAALFDGACVVHLFRPDIVSQLMSYRAARQTGRWDHSTRQTSDPVSAEDVSNLEGILSDIETLVEADAGFRRLFALLGIRPLFVTMEELFDDPPLVINSIARKLGVAINASALKKMVARSSPYPISNAALNAPLAKPSETLKRHAFMR